VGARARRWTAGKHRRCAGLSLKLICCSSRAHAHIKRFLYSPLPGSNVLWYARYRPTTFFCYIPY
jgi:hypothetical protein